MREDSTATSNTGINNSTDCKHQMEQIREDPRLQQPSLCSLHRGNAQTAAGGRPVSSSLNAKEKLSDSLPPLTRHAAYKQERGNATLSLLNVTIRSKTQALQERLQRANWQRYTVL